MTDAQKRFCEEYLISLNATQAYKIAYPNVKKDNTAKSAGNRLLTNVDVQDYIRKRQKELSKKTEITQERVLNEIAKIAFADLRDLYDDRGIIKPIQDLNDNIAGSLSSIETVEEFDTVLGIKVKTGEVKKVKTNDKVRALEMLSRHLGLFNDKVDVNASFKYEDYIKSIEDKDEY